MRTLNFDASAPLQLANGDTLSPFTIGFETYGALNSDASNAVLVCAGLGDDQFAASPNPVTGRPAWWPRIVGPGRPIDTNRFYVICTDTLGGWTGSSGPASIAPDGQPFGMRFPAISIADMVRAQSMLVEALGISSLFLATGVGLGGMQVLQWASAYPKRVFACAPIATAARRSAQNAAMHELGRQAIMADPDWRNGDYATQAARPAKGLSVARLAAQIANDGAPDFTARFDRLASGAEKFEDENEINRPHARFDANSFLYLTRALDHFDLGQDFGGDLANAFRGAAARTCVFSFSSDWRYPPAASREIVRALIAAGADASSAEIESGNGHNAYARNEPAFEAALTGFIDSAAAARGLALSGVA
ncbi:MAG: homoserine O-acetyltransferase [Hyphomonadaceae bacterium]